MRRGRSSTVRNAVLAELISKGERPDWSTLERAQATIARARRFACAGEAHGREAMAERYRRAGLTPAAFLDDAAAVTSLLATASVPPALSDDEREIELALIAERLRIGGIQRLARERGVPEQLVTEAIERGTGLEDFKRAMGEDRG